MKRNLTIIIVVAVIATALVLFRLKGLSAQSELASPQFFIEQQVSADILPEAVDEETAKALLTLIAVRDTFPDKIMAIGYDDGDWFLEFTNRERLFWAKARFLPAHLRKNYKNYKRYISYEYSPDIKDPSTYSRREVRKLKKEGSPSAQKQAPTYELTYIELIYGGVTEETITPHIKKTEFLGFPIETHETVVEPLKRVEVKIHNLAAQDNTEVQDFLSSLENTGSFYWRNIAGSRSLSWHSIGIAVDVIPQELNNKIVYWAWQRPSNANWPSIPLKNRWQPPQPVIEAFESEGFIWGGKWSMFDTIHFEYRPELHRLYQLKQLYQLETGKTLHNREI
jgi:hypothetical protein